MKIVVLDGYTLNPGDLDWTGLTRIGDTTIHERTGTDEELIVERATDAEVVLTNKTPMPRPVLERLPRLSYIGVLATGYDTVDLDAAAERGISVTNIPAYGTDSVAQMAFAHLLAACHRVAEHSRDVRAGNWALQADVCYWLSPQIELAGRTMGIVGFGRIGRRVGQIAHAFGMKVVAYDPYHGEEPGLPDFEWKEIDDVFRESDVVSLHCPLTPETAGMVAASRLATMKRSAILLNTARGPLVVGRDLAAALADGTIAGAGIDVLESEPPESDHPLYDAPNVTITPHIAWATRSARSRLLVTAVENLQAFLAGAPQNLVGGR